MVEVIKNDQEKRTTDICAQQFQYHIVAPAVGVATIGETVIFIDAFDESGDLESRKPLLEILTKRASELPAGLRIVITSRLEPDVQDALRFPLPKGVDLILTKDVPDALTSRDINTYVKSSLSGIEELRAESYQAQLDLLVQKAGTSFQWASTACRLITNMDHGDSDPREQLAQVLSLDDGLDKLYLGIMKQYFTPADQHRSNKPPFERLKSVLGRILSAQEPLPLSALARLLPPNLIFGPDDLSLQRRIIRSLGSLLDGTHSDTTPVMVLHASYREFLYDPERSGDFHIDPKEAHGSMALGCLQVMEAELKFNICDIRTSFLPNHKIPNIESRVREHISVQLSYASRNWGFHLSEIPDTAAVPTALVPFLQERFLAWLEVTSLTRTSPYEILLSLKKFKVYCLSTWS